MTTKSRPKPANQLGDSTYSLVDCGHFRKLEQVGPFRVVRQALSAVWTPKLANAEWQAADAEFIRGRDGSGEWQIRHPDLKNPFPIVIDGLRFQIRLTSFGHLGLFPEQKKPWAEIQSWVRAQKAKSRDIQALNLFAYTGGSTLAAAVAGAKVAHVDASKGTVKWASENAKLNELAADRVRWLVDDVREFVSREVRRDSRYQLVILDPPSYGKGGKGEIWKIEHHLLPLLREVRTLVADQGEVMIVLSAHTEGYTPVSLSNQVREVFGEPSFIAAEELTIADSFGRDLPSGAGVIWRGNVR